VKGARLPKDAAFAAVLEGGDPGRRGRALFLADQSVFIDEMMLQRDNENFDFAFNCLEWLTEGGRRDRVLFMDQGTIQTEFGMPVPPLPVPEPPLPTQEELVPAVNQWLRDMEDKDVFNQLLLDLTARHPSQTVGQRRFRIWQGVAIGGTVVLLAYGLYRLERGRLRREAPGDVGLALLTAPAADLVGQRHGAMRRQGNLWEAARALARQGLETATEIRAPGPDGEPPPCPPFAVAGPWWRRWRLRRWVRQFWQLAYSTAPRPVSPRQFARMTRHMEQVTAALAEGSLRLAPTAERPGPPR
jgi:hypothetical protein